MTFDMSIKNRFDTLTIEKQNEVVDFIIFLSNGTENVQKRKRNFPFDSFKSDKYFMSDDFDEIPEDFNDYV